jgi:ribonuclease HII
MVSTHSRPDNHFPFYVADRGTVTRRLKTSDPYFTANQTRTEKELEAVIQTTNKLIAGVDEAGRGPLAGPVVAAAVVLPEGYSNDAIQDSKKLSKRKRDILYEVIKRDALSWAIVSVGHHRIEKHNILRASLLAMELAAKRVEADLILVDGNQRIRTDREQQTVIGGDALHVQISAASILAKVWRDQLMERLDNRYPGYDLAKHSGYPTAAHRAAIARLGICPVHRRGFNGVSDRRSNSGDTKNASLQASLLLEAHSGNNR